MLPHPLIPTVIRVFDLFRSWDNFFLNQHYWGIIYVWDSGQFWFTLSPFNGLPGCNSCKESASNAGATLSFHPWVWKIPWRKKWQLTSVFLPETSHRQRSLEGSMGLQRVGHDWTHVHSPSLQVWLPCLHMVKWWGWAFKVPSVKRVLPCSVSYFSTNPPFVWDNHTSSLSPLKCQQLSLGSFLVLNQRPHERHVHYPVWCSQFYEVFIISILGRRKWRRHSKPVAVLALNSGQNP